MGADLPSGLVHDLSDDAYRALPGLSATSMKWLLRSPAYYRQRLAHRVERSEFDLGHAVHSRVLGTGAETVLIPEELLAANGAASTKASKEFIEAARAAGQVPVKADTFATVTAIAEAVLRHAKARPLLERDGDPEVSIFADDPESGVPLRGRIDWLTTLADGRSLNVDLKTTTDARTHNIVRTVETYGYDIQSEAYRHLLRLTGHDPAPTHLIFVEVDPPHEVHVVQLAHEDWINGGSRKMRRAIDVYARCAAAGLWPGADDAPGAAEPIVPRPYYLADLDAMEDVA